MSDSGLAGIIRWASCPTKSVAADKIEVSVVEQLRAALSTDAARQQCQISDADWHMFEEGAQEELVRAVVESIGYDGATGAVSLKLGGGESRQ